MAESGLPGRLLRDGWVGARERELSGRCRWHRVRIVTGLLGGRSVDADGMDGEGMGWRDGWMLERYAGNERMRKWKWNLMLIRIIRIIMRTMRRMLIRG